MESWHHLSFLFKTIFLIFKDIWLLPIWGERGARAWPPYCQRGHSSWGEGRWDEEDDDAPWVRDAGSELSGANVCERWWLDLVSLVWFHPFHLTLVGSNCQVLPNLEIWIHGVFHDAVVRRCSDIFHEECAHIVVAVVVAVAGVVVVVFGGVQGTVPQGSLIGLAVFA